MANVSTNDTSKTVGMAVALSLHNSTGTELTDIICIV